MGETTCLLQSFSNSDISTCMAEKVDPMHLLRGSISFGRYMTEGLDWGKWSVFSHNRYVEEAAKFSKQGSVAEKKAYFEAQHKRRAALKAAASVQEADGLVNSCIQMNSKENIDVTNIGFAHTNEDKHDIQQCEVEISRMELPKDKLQPLVDKNFVTVHISNQFDNVAASRVEKLRDLGNPRQVKAREVKSSSKPSTKTTVSKPLRSHAERKTPVKPKSRISNVPNNKRTVRGSAEKKRLSSRSHHMSINLPSFACEASKTASVLQQDRIRKINLNSPNISRDQPVVSRTLVREIRDLFNRASVNSQSEGSRTKRPYDQSACKGMPGNVELSSSSDLNKCRKSPSKRHPQSSTISSPFRFRCEGRVAKRKEFFQRMVEIKSKEVEKMQLQRKNKEKIEHDHKKLQQRSDFKPKQKENKNGSLHLPSNEMKKPQSPKPTSKGTSRTSNSLNSRNSYRPASVILNRKNEPKVEGISR